jgi:hypothetical protein
MDLSAMLTRRARSEQGGGQKALLESLFTTEMSGYPDNR